MEIVLFKGIAVKKNKLTVQDVISVLNLEPLGGEGGFFRQTYRSSIFTNVEGLGKQFVSTAIYFLITSTEFSAFHKLKQDEVYHFYAGDPVDMLQIFPGGQHNRLVISNDLKNGQRPQILVPTGVWHGSRLNKDCNDKYEWALLGTTVAPGFEYVDFELGVRDELIKKFPTLEKHIIRFTRSL